MLLPACSSNLGQKEQAIDYDKQTSVTQNGGGISFEGGYDVFDRRYIDVVENLYYGMQIVGEEATEKWVNEVYLKQDAKGQTELPELYQMIKYFSIPREELIKVNNSFKNQKAESMVIPDDVINALYSEDEKSMKKALASPLALYYDGMIYTVNELRQMSSDEIKKIGITPAELEKYANNIDEFIRANVSDKLYDSNYKDTIMKLKEISAQN
jgi:hypothetical protein